MGINVRKKAENIVALLNNKEKISEIRDKATINRNKLVSIQVNITNLPVLLYALSHLIGFAASN